MLCDRVLGNVVSDTTGRYTGRTWDALELTWRECTRRALRGRTASGRPVGVLLPLGTHLRHGDVLADDGGSGVVAVSVTPCEVWVAEFADSASMTTAALELGNLHVPVEVSGERHLVTIPDGPTRGVFDQHASSWKTETRRFQALRATVAGGDVQFADTISVVRTRPSPQLTNSRE